MGNKIWLYPSLLRNEEPVTTKVAILVTWIDHSVDEQALISITDAFDAYTQKRYQDAIIPANVAVESALSVALNYFLSSKLGKQRVEDFLTNAATYSHQLNIMLPLISGLLAFPSLPNEIRGQLNRLRDYRNQMSHKGLTENVINKDDMAVMLCAAVFGLQYVLHIQSLFKNVSEK